MTDLTAEEIQTIEEWITIRMEEAGATREEACDYLTEYFQSKLDWLKAKQKSND
jgi:hypothetical protein